MRPSLLNDTLMRKKVGLKAMIYKLFLADRSRGVLGMQMHSKNKFMKPRVNDYDVLRAELR